MLWALKCVYVVCCDEVRCPTDQFRGFHHHRATFGRRGSFTSTDHETQCCLRRLKERIHYTNRNLSLCRSVGIRLDSTATQNWFTHTSQNTRADREHWRTQRESLCWTEERRFGVQSPSEWFLLTDYQLTFLHVFFFSCRSVCQTFLCFFVSYFLSVSQSIPLSLDPTLPLSFLSFHAIQRHLASISEQIWTDGERFCCVCVKLCDLWVCVGEGLCSTNGLFRNLSRVFYENVKIFFQSFR